jgi:hypothetical protein
VLDAITRFALIRRGLTIAAAVALVVAGVWAFRQLKLEAYPDISDTGVVVIATYPGFAAEEGTALTHIGRFQISTSDPATGRLRRGRGREWRGRRRTAC